MLTISGLSSISIDLFDYNSDIKANFLETGLPSALG